MSIFLYLPICPPDYPFYLPNAAFSAESALTMALGIWNSKLDYARPDKPILALDNLLHDFRQVLSLEWT